MIKRLLFLALFFSFVCVSFAQPRHTPNYLNRSQVEFVSNGDRFWLYLNDRQFNNRPEKVVTVNDLNASEIYQVRIVMDNQRREEFTESIAIHSEEAIVRLTIARDRNPRSSYALWLDEQIIHADRGFYTDVWQELVIQLHSDVKRMPAPGQGYGQGHAHNSHNNPAVPPAHGHNNPPIPPSHGHNPHNNPHTQGNASVNTQNQSTTVVIVNEQTPPPPAPVVVVAEPPVPLHCPEPEFRAILATIESQTFSNDKLMVARQVVPNKAMTAAQIAQIAKVLEFENDRIEFLKFAYHTCFDPENYYVVYNSLDFSSSKEELIKYIK